MQRLFARTWFSRSFSIVLGTFFLTLAVILGLRWAVAFEVHPTQPLDVESAPLDPAVQGLIDEGYEHFKAGDYQGALEVYERAFDLTDPDSLARAEVLQRLGICHKQRGDYHQALVLYGQGKTIAKELESRRDWAQALHNEGKTYMTMLNWTLAEQRLREAHDLWPTPWEQAITVVELAQIASQKDDMDGAKTKLRQAFVMGMGHLGDVDRVSAVDWRRSRASALETLGYIAFGDEDWKSARKAYASAHRKTLHDGYPEDAIRNLGVLGQVQGYLGECSESIDNLETALGLASRQDRREYAIHLLRLAAANRSMGDRRQAAHLLVEATDLLDLLQSNPRNLLQGAEFMARLYVVYELLIQTYMELHGEDPTAGYGEAALRVVESSRARSLRRRLLETPWVNRWAPDPELVDRLGSLEHRRLRARWEGAPMATFAEIERQQRLLLSQLEDVWDPGPRAEAIPVVEVHDLQEQLPDGTRVLLFSLGFESSYLWMITPTAVESHTLADRRTLEGLIQSTLDGMTGRNASHRAAADDAAHEVAELLLGPVADRLAEDRLIIIPDGALHLLPFAALPNPRSGRLLVQDHALSRAPSMSTLLAIRQRYAEDGTPRFDLEATLFGDAVYGLEDSRLAPALGDGSRTIAPDRDAPERLHHAGEELAALERHLGGAPRQIFTGFRATRQQLESLDLRASRILHFSVHGEVNEANPRLSHLVLGLRDAHGASLDGRLFVHEIDDLDLRCDLMVLSACDTAGGKVRRGEGMEGMAQAVLAAGARRALVSLWPVDDRATAALMDHFYRGLLAEGLPPAQALRQAQRDLAQDPRGARHWESPYFWAGFVLIGDWS